ncbi:hypothetical protein CVT25_011206 [Psilocybe cyanescens]|uniref:MARVEL domain-containing protein n=1 Tax=Psilocybe cyanescens TaxID=93625 RepID=A0A409WH14_PSICY|nr:hypothetical protein CVT25_011206 [Psilocybe cyanescens]
MTVRFGNNRLGFYVAVFILSGVVLGLGANFANEFLPHLRQNFTIFSIVVSSLTILTFLLTLQWATPYSEAVVLFVLGTLWLAMGAWSTDVIGPLQCDSLAGQKTPSKNGETNLQAFCYEMKVIQAFSWTLFCLFVIAFYVLHQLAGQAQRYGRHKIWSEPIRELPWFEEAPGYYNTNTYGPNAMQYPPPSAGGYGYPYYPGGMGGMPMLNPGHSLMVQPGMNTVMSTV